jgi:hypothetical protein
MRLIYTQGLSSDWRRRVSGASLWMPVAACASTAFEQNQPEVKVVNQA